MARDVAGKEALKIIGSMDWSVVKNVLLPPPVCGNW